MRVAKQRISYSLNGWLNSPMSCKRDAMTSTAAYKIPVCQTASYCVVWNQL